MSLEPGTRVGPYVIEDQIGRGGFATVYRADDARFGGAVAIKVLAEHLASEDEAVERFVAEARALRAVDNDSVVSVFDISETEDGRPYMVLQYADRGTLLDRLRDGPAATSQELVRIADFFAQSLGAVAERSMVHRDVKPSNVLISAGVAPPFPDSALLRDDDRLLLGDLGLVKDISDGTVTRGSGSAAYASPEQRAVVSRVDTRTDLYAASAVLAEAALGRVRDPEETWGDVLRIVQASHGAPLATALRHGLSEDPGERPATPADLAAEVRRALGSDDPQSATLTSTRRIRRPRLALAGLAFMLIGVGGLVLAFNQSTPSSAVAASSDGPRVSTATPVPATAVPTVTPELLETPPPTAQVGSSASVVAQDTCSNAERGTEDLSAPTGFAVSDVTASTVTIEWDAVDQPFSLFLDGRYLDNARKNSFQYVIEGLEPESSHEMVIAAHDVGPEAGALVCTTTLGTGDDAAPLGVVMATDLAADEVTSTSVLLTWSPATSGGRYTLYSGNLPAGKNFPTIVGAGGVGPDETSFLFEDLEPGTRNVVGLRTIQGENQSGLAWIEVDLPE